MTSNPSDMPNLKYVGVEPTNPPRRYLSVNENAVVADLAEKVAEWLLGTDGMICEASPDEQSVVVVALKPPPMPLDKDEEERAWGRVLEVFQAHDEVYISTAVVSNNTFLRDRILVGTDYEQVARVAGRISKHNMFSEFR